MIDANALIAAARKHLGAPYVWQGKGKVLWTPRGLEAHPWVGYVFDCSGLVTHAIKQVGGPDWRATMNAQALFDHLPIADDFAAPGVLRFYGSSRSRVSHVEICTGIGADGKVTTIGANGGDSTTLTPVDAQKRGGMVREGHERRRDFLGARSIP